MVAGWKEIDIEHLKAPKSGKTCGKIGIESKILPVLFIFQFFRFLWKKMFPFCSFDFFSRLAFFRFVSLFVSLFVSFIPPFPTLLCFVLFFRVDDYSVVIYILQEGLVETEWIESIEFKSIMIASVYTKYIRKTKWKKMQTSKVHKMSQHYFSAFHILLKSWKTPVPSHTHKKHLQIVCNGNKECEKSVDAIIWLDL